MRLATCAIALLAAVVAAAGGARAQIADASLSSVAALYRQGVQADGRPLVGQREAGLDVQGAAAACAACHRRSGLGASEGRTTVPPITGSFLFSPRSSYLQDFGEASLTNRRAHREGYDEASLARAIRDGVDPSGRTLSYLMPRYALGDADIHALATYLSGLSAGATPGVTEETLHFATVITPDADPVARAAMLEVMRKFFDDKNAFIRGGSRRLQSNREIHFRVQRRWQLHVWELQGAESTWEAQLRAKSAAEPVFAIVSGLGGRQWAPVHRFCEREAIPCLFPNVDAPVVAERDFYSLYYSRGIHLETDLMAARLGEVGPGSRVVQVFRRGDIGAEAAAELAATIGARGASVVARPLGPDAGAADLQSALETAQPGDRLVLWLRPADLKALPAPRPVEAYVSGLMAGMDEAPLPRAWRGMTHMTYLVDLPERRRAGMSYARGWFKIGNIPVTAERVQTDTYIACGILAEALADMLDNFRRDYLVERIETMLSHRLVTGFYPRLSLAPGQRFASKGGYFVRLPQDGSSTPVAEGDWIVPEQSSKPAVR
ncbi:c-type cytochrome [Ramlibacter sp. MMS24-I3-19]|uniref:c-type cytochrome n=1 Tax=Ramlibacter sp. MMS24-I3-19 TaxID=3416606 RepID=UPI003D050EE6